MLLTASPRRSGQEIVVESIEGEIKSPSISRKTLQVNI